MNLFNRKRPQRNERIVLATTGDVAELDSSPLVRSADRRSTEANNPAEVGDKTRLHDLSDLELFGTFVVSRGNGDRKTMAMVQGELENRGKADELVHL